MTFRSTFALAALIVPLAAAVQAAPISTTDAFSGASIVGTVNVTTAQAARSFDGLGTNPNGVTFFDENQEEGTVGTISFDTATAVSLSGIRLFAGYDVAFDRRAMSNFSFFVDTDGDGAFTQLIAQAINPEYAAHIGNEADPASPGLLELTFMFAETITSSHWRYSVTQAGPDTAFSGVRVREVDAISAAVAEVPEPATLALAGVALAGLALTRRRSR